MEIHPIALPYMGALIFSGFLSLVLAIKAYRAFNYRRMPFAKYFIMIMLSMAIWSVNYAFEVGFLDIEYKYLFARLEYFGMAFAPVAWFLFSAEYSGMFRTFIRRYEKLFFVIPVFTIFSVFTNSLHGLHFTSYSLDTSGGFPLLVFKHGLFFWLFYVYSFFLIFLGILFFVRQFVRLTIPYRSQAAIALTAACIPVLGNVLHIADIGPFEFFDPTPFSFTITGIILFWGAMQHEFLSIIPIARENVIESMSDGYIVVDLSNFIVDINEAALVLKGKTRKEAIGKSLDEFFGGEITLFSGEEPEGSLNREFSLKDGSQPRFFNLTVTPLEHKDASEGSLVMIHDITEIYRYQEALKQANKKINLMSNITRHDILNQVNVLSGYTELISEMLPPDIKEDSRISRYLKNLNKGIETIHNQIIFTRDYQDLGVVSPTWQSVSGDVREAAFAFSGQGISFSIEDSSLEVYADPLLRKAFYNLFDNSRAHGESVTEISCSSRTEGEDIVIEIRDNGVGVPEDMKELIFEKSVGKNTGLGLFLVRGILSITGMGIKETGKEGEGAKFEITVPAGNWRKVSPDLKIATGIATGIASGTASGTASGIAAENLN